MDSFGGPSGITRGVLAALLMAVGQTAGAGLVAARDHAAAVRMEGTFVGNAGKPAKDLSGIACRPLAGPDGLSCLLVNDESDSAQMATLRDGRLVAGDPVPLVGSEPPASGEAAGSASRIGGCPDGPGEFGEFDGEGVAWSPAPSGGGSYFITGSHACGREEPKLKASTHLLARIDVDGSGGHRRPVLTWRLGPALRATPDVGAHYNLRLDREAKGLDIEGIAASGGRLFFGLRAPSIDGFAYVVSADAGDLFSADDRPDPVPTRVAKLKLGTDVGIRDMALLPDGRLLLLTGPTQKQDAVRPGILLATPGGAEEWPVHRLVAGLRPLSGNGEAKAEGLAVLGVSGDTARVLVLFEDPANSGAQEHTLRLPPR